MTQPVFPATRLGVFAFENPNVGTQVVAGRPTVTCLIGESFGAVTTIQNELITRTPSTLLDALAQSPAVKLLGVGDAANGLFNYILGTDFRLSGDNLDIEWLNTFIAAPAGLVGVAATVTPTSPRTGLSADTYDYVLTAIREIDAISHAIGETVVSSEVAVVVGGPDNAVRLTWTPSVNAQGYKLYRKLSTDPDYTNALITTIPGGASNSFLDDGYAEGTGTPPMSNTATNRPADNAAYYATYVAVIQTYNTPMTFFSLSQLVAAHGFGSDLSIAGAMILGGPGVGQNASLVMTIAIPDQTEASYQAALAVLATKQVDIIVPLTGDTAVQLDVAEHVVAMSEPLAKKNRTAIFGSPRGTPIGDVDTVGSIVWRDQRLVLNDASGNPAGKRIWYVSETGINYNVQGAAGVFTATDLDGWFYAAAVAGAIAALPQVCTPLTNKQIVGINSLADNWNQGERDILDANGLITSVDNSGVIEIYHGRTSDLFTVQHAEISIVRTSDFIVFDLIKAFAPYFGNNITQEFEDSLKSDTQNRLAIYQKNTIIAGFDAGSVEVLAGISGDPRRVDVTFAATPFYPANQIVFSFSFV